jgi:putative lipoic acid-binding regulatory protein
MIMKRSFPLATTAVASLLVFGSDQPISSVQSFALPVPLDRPTITTTGTTTAAATTTRSSLYMSSQSPPPNGPQAGSFFHKVPDDAIPPKKKEEDDTPTDDDKVDEIKSELINSSSSSSNYNDDENDKNLESKVGNDSISSRPSLLDGDNSVPEFDIALSKILEKRRRPPRASRPSTINGIPIEKVSTGFGKSLSTTGNAQKSNKPYIAVGPLDDGNDVPSSPISPTFVPSSQSQPRPINDPTKPEFDDQGYTLYTDSATGKKSRVFEALVEYPCTFTLKIVGANEGDFVKDMVAVVAEACDTTVEYISHTTKQVGPKWTSVTVLAPVENSEMLYTLYEKVDLDPRVKFKF